MIGVRLTARVAFVAIPALLLAACSGGQKGAATPTATPTALSPGALREEAIKKIKHVVIIMQENRTFDHYFGTFPAANGIPMAEQRADSLCP